MHNLVPLLQHEAWCWPWRGLAPPPPPPRRRPTSPASLRTQTSSPGSGTETCSAALTKGNIKFIGIKYYLINKLIFIYQSVRPPTRWRAMTSRKRTSNRLPASDVMTPPEATWIFTTLWTSRRDNSKCLNLCESASS